MKMVSYKGSRVIRLPFCFRLLSKAYTHGPSSFLNVSTECNTSFCGDVCELVFTNQVLSLLSGCVGALS